MVRGMGFRRGALLSGIVSLSFSVATPHTPRADIPEEFSLPSLALPAQQHDFDSFDLTSALPPAAVASAAPIALPSICAEYMGPDEECTSDMTALNVTYEDCGSGFIICRCADAQMSMDTVLDRFGRVPVGLRRYAGAVFVMSDVEAHAYTLTTGDTHFFGDCAVDSWVHEMTHAYDFAEAEPQSSWPGWAEALAADSCVPDVYSQTNEIEDFAQISVMKIYMLLHSGSLPPGFTADCLSNQLAFVDALPLYNAVTLFGNTCAILDTSPLARHTRPPATLDPTRTFRTVAPDPSVLAVPDAAATTRISGAQRSQPSVIQTIFGAVVFAVRTFIA